METLKPKVHFTATELLNPVNPVSVCLIGAGGTGSQVLSGLARMSHSLNALGHAGFQVSLWDDNVITQANMGRQLFSHSELGLQKSVALITRTNRFFGTQWKAVEKQFNAHTAQRAAVYISCTDTAAARFGIAEALKQLTGGSAHSDMPRYWMDFGNAKDTGQVILSTVGSHSQPESQKFSTIAELPFITEQYGELLHLSDTDDTPSCSLAEALEKQDLFINGALAQLGCSLLWQLLRNGFTAERGFFLNISKFTARPVLI